MMNPNAYCPPPTMQPPPQQMMPPPGGVPTQQQYPPTGWPAQQPGPPSSMPGQMPPPMQQAGPPQQQQPPQPNIMNGNYQQQVCSNLLSNVQRSMTWCSCEDIVCTSLYCHFSMFLCLYVYGFIFLKWFCCYYLFYTISLSNFRFHETT